MKKVILLVLLFIGFGLQAQNIEFKEKKSSNVEDLSLLPSKDLKVFNQSPPCFGYESDGYHTTHVYWSTLEASWIWVHTVGGTLTYTLVSDITARVICSKTKKITIADD